MAILWHEMWHEALEEASRQYFGESNVEAMLSTLMPLHEMMQANGGITLKEIAFVKVPLPLGPCLFPFSSCLWHLLFGICLSGLAFRRCIQTL